MKIEHHGVWPRWPESSQGEEEAGYEQSITTPPVLRIAYGTATFNDEREPLLVCPCAEESDVIVLRFGAMI